MAPKVLVSELPLENWFLCAVLLCCFAAARVQGSLDNATDFWLLQEAQVPENASFVALGDSEEGQGDELALESVDDAAMLHWAIEHADPDKLRDMAVDARGWSREQLEAKHAEIQQLLDSVRPPSDFEVMEALLAVATNSSEPVTRRCGALEALQEVVEAIDNARDLEKLGGIHTLVALLADTEKDVRRAAAWVVGAAAQNNPEVQDQFLKTSCLPALLEIVKSADPDEAARALYALSALVRDNTHGLTTFYQHGGPALLETILVDESAEIRLQRKGVGLLGDLSLFQGDRQAPEYAPLTTSKMLRALLRLMSTGDVDMREKVVRAIHALLANNPGALRVFQQKAMELEKLRKIEERLEA